jgi:hypothetical protein
MLAEEGFIPQEGQLNRPMAPNGNCETGKAKTMDTRKLVVPILIILAIPALALAQASREANWIPSGKIEIGNPQVEARFRYWVDSPEINGVPLPFAGGPKISRRGRTASAEQFTVPVATWRHGPCKGALVIRKVWDTGAAFLHSP